MDQIQTGKAWYLPNPGLENLTIVEQPVPVPKGNDVLIRVIRAAVNPVDWKRCTFVAPGRFAHPGFVGVDGFGMVVGKGELVSSLFEINKTYVYFHGNLSRQEGPFTGSFAEYSIQDATHLSIIQESLLTRQGLASDLVSMACTGWTAYQAVVWKLKLQPGSVHVPQRRSVVVTGGAGGVGSYCLQLLKLYRASLSDPSSFRIISTCSKSNFEYVLSQGATDVIDRGADLREEIKALCPGGVSAWIDSVGKDTATVGLQSLAFGGELVVVVENPDYTNDDLFFRQLSIHNVILVPKVLAIFKGAIHGTKDPNSLNELKQIGDRFQELFADGKLKPIKYSEIEFEGLKEALSDLKAGKSTSKFILKTSKP